MHQVLTVLCYVGWVLLAIGLARIGWHIVMHW